MKTKEKMTQLNVEIPESLKRAIKVGAAMDGVTLQEWTIAALRAADGKKLFNSGPETTESSESNLSPPISKGQIALAVKKHLHRRAASPTEKSNA